MCVLQTDSQGSKLVFMVDLKSPSGSGDKDGGEPSDSTPKTKRRRIGRNNKRGTPGTPEVVVYNSLLGVPGIEEFMREVISIPGAKLSLPKKHQTGDVPGAVTEEDKQRYAFK